MRISISDVTQRSITLDRAIICFSTPKKEIIEGVTKLVLGVVIESGKRILNPDYIVDVKSQFTY